MAFILIILAALLPLAAPAAVDFGLGVDYTNFNYEEKLTPPSRSTESAQYPALVASLRMELGQFSYVKLQGKGLNGVVSVYDGSTLATNQPVLANNRHDFHEGEMTMIFGLGPAFAFQLGAGYRDWNRMLTGTPGYREVYSGFYFPVGFIVRLNQVLGARVSLDATYRPTANGKIKVITSENVANGVDSEMALGSLPGYRVALPMEAAMGMSWSWSLAPWYERSGYGESAVVANATLASAPGTGIKEPESQTERSGIEFQLRYRFGK